MYITTGEKEAGHLVERARNLAETTGGTYVPRKKNVFTCTDCTLWDR